VYQSIWKGRTCNALGRISEDREQSYHHRICNAKIREFERVEYGLLQRDSRDTNHAEVAKQQQDCFEAMMCVHKSLRRGGKPKLCSSPMELKATMTIDRDLLDNAPTRGSSRSRASKQLGKLVSERPVVDHSYTDHLHDPLAVNQSNDGAKKGPRGGVRQVESIVLLAASD